jgi:hypothetical protein
MSLLDQVEQINVQQFLAEFGHIRLYCTGFKKPGFLFFEGFISISPIGLIKLRAHVNATPSFDFKSPLVGEFLWKRAQIQPHAEVWRRNSQNVLTLVEVVEPPHLKMDQSSKLTLID